MADGWWRGAVFYEIYVRSFADSNGDGIGDLPGITSRLDYLKQLGVDAVWLTPFYPSPQKDHGYDVADYYGVNSEYGTLEDFDRLVSKAHSLGIKVLVDLVPNHTSDQHWACLVSTSSTRARSLGSRRWICRWSIAKTRCSSIPPGPTAVATGAGFPSLGAGDNPTRASRWRRRGCRYRPAGTGSPWTHRPGCPVRC